tara:strand:- start:137 stop:1162 length:1026 start_codon:yes stop_codon:yes gene_type:complete
MINFLKKIKKIITEQSPPLLPGLKNKIDHNLMKYDFASYGDLNKDKYFYLIKRSPGTGLFSNVTFILNHMIICRKLGFIPIIDMGNYNTIYNEKRKVKNTMNSWLYYFEPLNSYKLEDVYKSKYVLISDDKFYHSFNYRLETKKEFVDMLQQEIKVRKGLYKIFLKISKRFEKKNTLGIHFRGTSYKNCQGHPFPPTKKQMLKATKEIISKNNIDIIFLVTEEKNYLEFFQKNFPNKLFFLKSSYRSNKNDAFKVYPRNLHRYKLGREALLEALLLSKCDHFIYLCSNLSSASISFNYNNKQKRYEIDNGNNSKNFIISRYLWYLKKILPTNMGGFGDIKI